MINTKLNKALKDFLRSGSVDNMQDSSSIEVLKEYEMIFPVVEMEHDDLIEKLHIEMAKAEKSKVVQEFLSGLENNEPQKRAALSAYAIMQKFPDHKFESHAGIQCDICSGFKKRKVDFTLVNAMRYLGGSTNNGAPEQLYFFLAESNREREFSVPSGKKMKAVLSVLSSASAGDTPVILEKKIRGINELKFSQDESRGLLDLLGHLGVLETPEHKGFLNEYKNIGLVPKKSRSTDWSYPVDFWLGEYGINENAVNFWFGDYLKN
ncbi:hypothetical protein OKW98_22265 [Pseudomonas sp. KU26590]|uniref:hypothetical protein n=1 Tax=Pseudomonas sp. KU26590 TaxID=2991051 RepID=UPI00223CC515|nr:hypothetical protein [Pseudomonas sp. KU26590]UZJ59250.1 hypothetical protein OKW98_22265 [Pseudomonas sp. KU26590]